MAKIAPSILGADFARLGDEIASADQADADQLHLDIMDGHFVPNISFGPGIVKTVRKLTDKFLDVHLMLSQPEKYFEPFKEAGSDSITFHIEVHPDPLAHAARLNDLGMKAGISLNPDSSIEQLLPFLERFDYLVVMSVFPGFGGQKFIADSLPRIETARKYIDQYELKTLIHVDGGIDADNAAQVVSAGADILIMGSSFFNSNDRAGLAKKIHAL